MQDGVAFTVTVETIDRQCVVTRDAIHALSNLKNVDNDDAEMMNLFQAYETTINGVARRLVSAGVTGSPLIMRAATFSAPRTE